MRLYSFISNSVLNGRRFISLVIFFVFGLHLCAQEGQQEAAYIQNKFDIKTTGKTAELILSDIDKLEIPADDKEKISAWLSRAEKEKYAPFEGEPGDIIRLITELENFFNKLG